MITLISPAKTLDFDSPLPMVDTSKYLFEKEAIGVMKKMKALSRKNISALMTLSEKLADLNYQRFQEWNELPSDEMVRPAVFMFKGEVYIGLDPQSLSEEELGQSQRNLRILSGLYGYLKPLDLVQAYRLEMGTKINIGRKKNLYEFWGNKISTEISNELTHHVSQTVVNLASNEYSKAANLKEIKGRVITPVFKDFKNGEYKVISFFAKKARGVMARWIIQENISEPNELIGFNRAGYTYNEPMSTALAPVFTRE